ncbi:28S ribosomal protein S22, mitochondrial-like isoform X2 [Gigantopelta aegis]|uniref:28S ribosomal protein S22, mitochondrial-like isoform X2 n=1 Tax=Gigantopelta aegis TaxID=1735272 RepID=UPI001B88AD22|nr:28S ribosomal protein S22, mitochondrial-like isoform X2 [Gigantopelta aegis]
MEKIPLKDGDDTSGKSAGFKKNPLPVYLSDRVQQLLQEMTGFDILKMAGPKPTPLSTPKYKLLTDEELSELQADSAQRMKKKLQMPPFMNPREPINEVLSHDPEIEAFDTSKLVMTDITFGMSSRRRLIVVRETDGTLRKASWDERDRLNQSYFPREGCSFVVPPLFQEENLERLLTKEKYVYVLDRACVQFEPDHPEYVRVTRRTYEHIDDHHNYEILRSTRHFGPMAFYYAWMQKIDYLLVDMIQRALILDGASLVRLYHILNPDCQSAHETNSQTADLDLIKIFCHTDARHKGQLELAIQGFENTMQLQSQAG